MDNLYPAVFVVKDSYHIMFYTEKTVLVSASIGGEIYYDESNGVMRSASLVHRIIVPKEELDAAGEYTIHERPIIERKPYFTETAEQISKTYTFRPVKSGAVRAYHISDTHNNSVSPPIAASVFGNIDFLIMNGDIPDHSGAMENCITIYKIASAVTRGEIPIVFSRGNHDMRGVLAEKFSELTPTDNGNSYYTFRLGNIWGMVLDCAEDKPDSHEEYGYTVCCHAFRKRQTAFIKRIIASGEHLAEGIRHRVVIAHNPFTHQLKPPFDIEKETYTEWARLLEDEIKPHAMICGHLHKLIISKKGSEYDTLGQPCTVVVGADINHKTGFWAGCGFDFEEDGIYATFTDSNGEKTNREKL